jgi:hypothetical protein
VYTRERKHIGTKWSRVTCLALRWLLLTVLEVKFLKIPKVVGA